MHEGVNETLRILAEGVRAGQRRAVARGITVVERGGPDRDTLMELLGSNSPATAQALFPRVVGITGPPGAGKSTLLGALIAVARDAGRRVAVLAVDPSSPFSGGALLGDRIRMNRHGDDAGVFIRSMASRGHSGGLSAAAVETVALLGIAGYEEILVESVGVGQSEVAIMNLADLVAVVLNPGAGDEIQALKAGVLEIADIFVINKADYTGVPALERELRSMCAENQFSAIPPQIVRTTATTGEGIAELYRTLGEQMEALAAAGALEVRRRQRASDAMIESAAELLRLWIGEQNKHRCFDSAGGVHSLPAFRRKLTELLDSIQLPCGGSDDGND